MLQQKNMANPNPGKKFKDNKRMETLKRDFFMPKQPEPEPSAASICYNETVQSSKQSTVEVWKS